MMLRKIIFALCVAGTLVFFGMDMRKKETILRDGRLVYFDMEVHDPRSLMQGDYMRIHYGISSTMSRRAGSALQPEGYLVVWLDSSKVAHFIRTQDQPDGLHDSELVVRYHMKNHRPVPGPTSYFFQEKMADCFSTARYIAMRVDDKGNAILTGLHDWDFCRLFERDSASYRQWLDNHPLPPPPPPRPPGRD